jgi:hypothetical protein
MRLDQIFAALLLLGIEALGWPAQASEISSVSSNLRGDCSSQIHKVCIHQAHDVEAIRHDLGAGEVASDQG